jgi:purine nucleosidase
MLLALCLEPLSWSKQKVIIDTDTTAFHPFTLDMEDDLAVLFALADPEFEVKGLTVTYGNGFQWQSYPDAKKLIALTGLPMPVFRGADYTSRNLARSTEATQFIRHTALREKDGITIIALGAMTNVAAALAIHPEIVPRINRIVMMGGNLKARGPDVNFAVHPEAANLIFASPIAKVILPAETCMQTVFTVVQLRQILAHPNTVVYQLRHRMKSYLGVWLLVHDVIYPPIDYPQKVSGGFIPWDSVAVAFAGHPGLFSDLRCFAVQMERGQLRASPCPDVGDHRGKAMVPMVLNRGNFDPLLMERLLAIKARR